jgi:hypothetical protein
MPHGVKGVGNNEFCCEYRCRGGGKPGAGAIGLIRQIAKSNASAGQSVVQLLETANANLQQVVNSAALSGVGASLDIRA